VQAQFSYKNAFVSLIFAFMNYVAYKNIIRKKIFDVTIYLLGNFFCYNYCWRDTQFGKATQKKSRKLGTGCLEKQWEHQ